jgi:hypothetical protein
MEDAKTTQSLLWYGRFTKLASADLLSSTVGVGEVHAAFLTESRAREPVSPEREIRVSSKR